MRGKVIPFIVALGGLFVFSTLFILLQFSIRLHRRRKEELTALRQLQERIRQAQVAGTGAANQQQEGRNGDGSRLAVPGSGSKLAHRLSARASQLLGRAPSMKPAPLVLPPGRMRHRRALEAEGTGGRQSKRSKKTRQLLEQYPMFDLAARERPPILHTVGVGPGKANVSDLPRLEEEHKKRQEEAREAALRAQAAANGIYIPPLGDSKEAIAMPPDAMLSPPLHGQQQGMGQQQQQQQQSYSPVYSPGAGSDQQQQAAPSYYAVQQEGYFADRQQYQQQHQQQQQQHQQQQSPRQQHHGGGDAPLPPLPAAPQGNNGPTSPSPLAQLSYQGGPHGSWYSVHQQQYDKQDTPPPPPPASWAERQRGVGRSPAGTREASPARLPQQTQTQQGQGQQQQQQQQQPGLLPELSFSPASLSTMSGDGHGPGQGHRPADNTSSSSNKAPTTTTTTAHPPSLNPGHVPPPTHATRHQPHQPSLSDLSASSIASSSKTADTRAGYSSYYWDRGYWSESPSSTGVLVRASASPVERGGTGGGGMQQQGEGGAGTSPRSSVTATATATKGLPPAPSASAAAPLPQPQQPYHYAPPPLQPAPAPTPAPAPRRPTFEPPSANLWSDSNDLPLPSDYWRIKDAESMYVQRQERSLLLGDGDGDGDGGGGGGRDGNGNGWQDDVEAGAAAQRYTDAAADERAPLAHYGQYGGGEGGAPLSSARGYANGAGR